jgi:two-component system LytT family sensor kinase
MMNITRHRYFNFILHALAWSVVLSFPFFIGSADNQYSIGPLPGFYFTLSGIVHIAIFYSNALFLYPKFLNRTYWLVYIVSVALLIYFSVEVKTFILERFFPNASPDARAHILFPSVLLFIISVFYSITVEKANAEKREKENKAMQLEVELKLLRSQVSPHFLFNILTNLVSLARKKSDHLEPSLLMLSDLMRYMLYDAGKKISLQQEVEYLRSYVALQELRFGRDVKITFDVDVPGEAMNHNIEPMLLIPFVENAFKHGGAYANNPFIEIRLAINNAVLDFTVKNKFGRESNNAKDENPGIGLNNVRSRLSLLYPGKHNLVINNDDNLFSIHLTLNL